jgi:hypothetical protein
VKQASGRPDACAVFACEATAGRMPKSLTMVFKSADQALNSMFVDRLDRTHSSRQYLHIDAVFVFDRCMDH